MPSSRHSHCSPTSDIVPSCNAIHINLAPPGITWYIVANLPLCLHQTPSLTMPTSTSDVNTTDPAALHQIQGALCILWRQYSITHWAWSFATAAALLLVITVSRRIEHRQLQASSNTNTRRLRTQQTNHLTPLRSNRVDGVPKNFDILWWVVVLQGLLISKFCPKWKFLNKI